MSIQTTLCALLLASVAVAGSSFGETLVDFSDAVHGADYKMAAGRFVKPEDATRQLTVGKDGLTAFFDTAREGKANSWATISVCPAAY